ncbi:MAG: MFS transporter [Ignavibacteriales bacterium]|nr:MFS transporter [Ignavibacteriales bacterium]
MNNRSKIFAWTLFDFANTSFSVIIVTVIYSRYFTNIVSGGQRILWGLAVSISMIIAAILSPPLGAAADSGHKRKRYLLSFTLISIICTALLFFIQPGMIFLGILLFVLANVGFEGGIVFYDAFLPGITSKKSYGRVSGYGFAMGYLGALFVLVIVALILPEQTAPEYYFFVRLSFVVAALIFLIFSIPLFLFVPETKAEVTRPSFSIGFTQSKKTFRAIFIEKQFPDIALFLISFFLYNDGILTVISFAAIFAENILKMSDKEIIAFFAVVQTSAIIGSIVFGTITDKIGPKKTISITLILWIGISIAAYFIQTVALFYIVALTAGIAIGSSQSASRSMMALLTPREREAEFFGFYDGLCGKASAVIGPLIYGIIADLTNEHAAAASIGIFFIIGFIVLQRVKEPVRI